MYQEILRIKFSISIIILNKNNLIRYIIQISKLKNPIYKYNSTKIDAGIKKNNKTKISGRGKCSINKKNTKKEK